MIELDAFTGPQGGELIGASRWASAQCQHKGDRGRLHAGRQSPEAGGADKVGEDGPEKKGSQGLSGPYWP